MGKFTDKAAKISQDLMSRFNEASGVQKTGILAVGGLAAIALHPALIAGGIVTGAVAAVGGAAGATAAFTKKKNGPKPE